MANNVNPETPEIDRKLPKSQKHASSLNGLPSLEDREKAINFLSRYHFCFNNHKSHFQAIIVNAN